MTYQNTLVDLGLKSDEGFKMLDEQKQELLQLIESGKASAKMMGLVHLIDHIQDKCVDDCGVPEEVVFPSLSTKLGDKLDELKSLLEEVDHV